MLHSRGLGQVPSEEGLLDYVYRTVSGKIHGLSNKLEPADGCAQKRWWINVPVLCGVVTCSRICVKELIRLTGLMCC